MDIILVPGPQSPVRGLCLPHTASCLPHGSQEPLNFLADTRQVFECALGGCDGRHQIIAIGYAATGDLGGEVARSGGACLTDCDGLRMRLQDFEKLLAFLMGHSDTPRRAKRGQEMLPTNRRVRLDIKGGDLD